MVGQFGKRFGAGDPQTHGDAGVLQYAFSDVVAKLF